MSWYVSPDHRINARETAQAQEAYGLLLAVDATQVEARLHQLLYALLSLNELEWLQERFDQDNGDPRIHESERTKLGPVWPAAARRLLRYAIFNDARRVTKQLDAKYETVVDADDVAGSRFLTEDPHITISLNVLYGTEFSAFSVPSTRLGMVSKMAWILIGANRSIELLPDSLRATNHVQLVYAKVLDPFLTSSIPESSFVMRGVTIVWDIHKKMVTYRMGEKISSLDEVVLLKHTILGPEGFLDRKAPSFSQNIRNIVALQMRAFIGGPWYMTENTPAKVFQ